MTDTYGHAQVVFKNVSGVPRDNVVNDFSFVLIGGGSVADSSADVATAIEHFYNNTPSTGTVDGPIAGFLGEQLSRSSGDSAIKVYDVTGHLSGGAVGSPVYSTTFTLGAGSGSGSLPEEVAACLTLRAEGWDTALVEGPEVTTIPTPAAAVRMGAPATHDGKPRPRQSLTGRLYIGPLRSRITDTAEFIGGLGGVYRQTLINAAKDLQTALGALDPVVSWCVWSRRTAGMTTIVRAECDNALDTMRKRGHSATVRSTLTL